MGSLESEEGRSDDEVQHEVTLTKGFWILETPVTQALWNAVMKASGNCYLGFDLPANDATWERCEAFVAHLNALGFAPEGMRFDFPTEAQWEYACRAGTTTRFNFGDEITDRDAYFKWDNYETKPVRKYPPNAWGLYDMHGNVWERCADWLGERPPYPATDPIGPPVALYRVLRGGSWRESASACRSAFRAPEEAPFDGSDTIGFRLALTSLG